jgi:hypothetical protein
VPGMYRTTAISDRQQQRCRQQNNQIPFHHGQPP